MSSDDTIYYTQIDANNPGVASCIKDTVIADAGLIFNKKVDLSTPANSVIS